MDGADARTRLLGKYRGKVLDNLDPLFLGRLIVECPAAAGMTLDWALPCAPYAGPGVGGFLVPPIGASVWVEFEAGDPNYPIWTGCFWSEGQSPQPELGLPTGFLKTQAVSVTINDQPGTPSFDLVVQPAGGAPIRIVGDAEGLAITVGEVRIAASDEAVTVGLGDSLLTLTPESATLASAGASLALVEDMVLIKGQIVTSDELA